jgi:hypothetical protein
MVSPAAGNTIGVFAPRRQPDLRLVADLLLGTFLPARRASDKPIAMACFRLLTLFPERPLFNVPRLRSCMALAIFFDAASLYFRAITPPLIDQRYLTFLARSGQRR